MSWEPERVRPLRHRLVVRVSPIVPSSALFPGLRPPPRHWMPWEIPQRLIALLVSFLNGRHPIPHRWIEPLLPASEAASARRLWRELLAEGLQPGEALVRIGLLVRPPTMFVPSHQLALILNRGCHCVCTHDDGQACDVTHVYLATGAGSTLDAYHCVIDCSEAVAGGLPATFADLRAAEAVERVALARLRLCAAQPPAA